MDKLQDIYAKIKGLAERMKPGETMTRADLAFELKDCGITHDSIEVSRLIYDAYRLFNDEKIRSAYVCNDKKQSVIDYYSIYYAVKNNDYDSTESATEVHLSNESDALEDLSRMIENTKVGVDAGGDAGFLSTITGTAGATNIQNCARTAYTQYVSLVDSYDNAVQNIRTTMSDFVYLREHASKIFRLYSNSLLDIFGESIKVIDPDIFDFDSVCYLETGNMLDTVRLEYDNLQNSCSVLIGDISESFSSSLNSSAGIYKTAGNRKAGLALAVLNMAGHYLDSASKTAALKRELLSFANKINKDRCTLQGDLARLYAIHRILSELYIPQARVFCQNASEPFTSDFQCLTDCIFSTDELKAIKSKRDFILNQLTEVNERLADAKINVNLYKTSIEATKHLIDGSKQSYEEAISRRPSEKTPFLSNLLTLGNASKRHNRKVSEWYDRYSQSVKYYEDLLVDMKLNQQELTRLESEIKIYETKSRDYRNELNSISAEIRQKLIISPEIKLKALSYLDHIVRLLKVSKQIINNSLDSKYLATVSIDKSDALPDLSPEIQANLKMFSDSVRSVVKDGIATSANQEDTIIRDKIDDTADKVVNLFEECIKLEQLHKSYAIADKEYSEWLDRIRQDFTKDMNDITAKGDIIRAAITRVNVASTADEKRDALISMLGQNFRTMGEDDFDKFLKGELNITI